MTHARPLPCNFYVRKWQLRDCCVRARHSVVLSWSRSACRRSLCRAWQFYRDTLLLEGLLPEIRELSEYFIFQQDTAPAHRARETVELLKAETPDFIPPTFWPPNIPDLSPVDYTVWSVMQEKVYKHRIKDADKLRQCIMSA